MKDFTYQTRAADQALTKVLSGNYLAGVLGACPGAGKTTISHMVINDYLKLYPNARVLVLTEGQNLLKSQYLNDLREPNVEIDFTFGEMGDDVQVKVGIPQSINKLSWDKIDLLIVDEAHNFYFSHLVQSIVKKFQPNHQLLLTGTPTKYTLHNENNSTKFGIVYISAEDLVHNNIFSKVSMDIVKVQDKNNPFEAVSSLLERALKNNDDTSKIMIACPSIAYAKKVGDNLKYLGRKVSLSTSDNDKDSVEIDKFKKGLTDTLIVVGRGILGFNDGNITMLADFRSSANLDAGYQIFARVLRTHPKGIRKTYYRLSNEKTFNKEVIFMHKIAAMMGRDVFSKFNGKNMKVTLSR